MIKIVEKKDSAITPFDELKDQIRLQMEGRQLREAMNEVMEELKKDAKIERKDDNIKVNIDLSKANTPQMGNPHMINPHGGAGGGAPQIKLPANLQQPPTGDAKAPAAP